VTPLERKIIRRAAEIAASRFISCIGAITLADDELVSMSLPEREALIKKFRDFYKEDGCPFANWQGDQEELRTIRVLLLETFLIFDGKLK
jgi:hypothetical protein